jgi:hypothetical protein
MPDTLIEASAVQLLEDPPDYSELSDDQFREIGEKIATINDLTGWELARWAHEAVENRGWSYSKCADYMPQTRPYFSQIHDAYQRFGDVNDLHPPISHAVAAVGAPEGYQEDVLEVSESQKGVRDAVRATKHIKNFHEELAEIGEIDESEVEGRIEDDFQREVVGSNRSASEIKKDLDQQLEYRKNGHSQDWDTAVLDSRLDKIKDAVIEFIDDAPEPFLVSLQTFLQEALSAVNDELSNS